MKEPNWLSREAVLAFHGVALARFGGSDGVGDSGALASALGRPPQIFHYGDPDLFDLATAYCAGIVRNNPFIDGNKRTGFIAAYTFLGLNGLRLEATEEEAAVQILALADGRLSEAELTDWLSRNCSARR